MRRPREPRELQRSTRFETFEERLALSSQPVDDFLLEAHSGQRLEHHYGDLAPAESVAPVGDFNLNLGITSPADNASRGVQTHLSEAHNLTGVNDVYNTYGFDGAGQTVAIIDSGIAYDHYALGAGFGTSYRVVGGWDFAENDANPYDDGPAGFHGTHVAGIVGSDNVAHRGVASGADLVALRVFDDNGAGYFSWVEDALRWVHDNRDSFENPITTVNLSLGTNWNADSIPSWAMLEDEFAQLELDGIFTSVSAGNSFVDFNAPGLSYPAASSHVVPVASVDDSGLLSYFSQRNDRVLAAPGRSITSTVPDYIFGADGNPNDFGTASGTSMAAPYTAGASVLVRQAMELVGIQNITQDTIYDHFRATADIVYDTVTSASYLRINVQAALDALMPDDDYGSVDAHALGTLNGSISIAGLIGTLDDADSFSFIAGATGSVSLNVSGDHELVPDVTVIGASGTVSNGTLMFDVTQGQTYSVSVQTAAGQGIGFYDVNLDLETQIVDWGAIEFSELDGVQVTGVETWYQLSAARTGLLTVEAAFDQTIGDIALELYNDDQQLLSSSSASSSGQRLDVNVGQADRYSLRIIGSNSDIDFRLANLVSRVDQLFTVQGTSGNDTFVLDAADSTVDVNGVRYDVGDVDTIQIDGGLGNDTIRVSGDSSDDSATLRPGAIDFVSDNYQLHASGLDSIYVYSGGGNDVAQMFDSAGNDAFYAWSQYSMMRGTGYYNYVNGFRSVQASAQLGGSDSARFYDSVGDDEFLASASFAELNGAGFGNRADGFDQVFAYATTGGFDTARLYDSINDDTYYSTPGQAVLHGAGFSNLASGFEAVNAYATLGNDTARLTDSTGDDEFYGWSGYAVLRGEGFNNYVNGFDSVSALATSGGRDSARLYDSAGNDEYYGWSGYSLMRGDGFSNYVRGFDLVLAYSQNGGVDTARFYDTIGDDQFLAAANHSQLCGAGYCNVGIGFRTVYAYADAGGQDTAIFLDVDGQVFGRDNLASLLTQDQNRWLWNFDQVTAISEPDAEPSADVTAVDYLFDQLGSWNEV